MSRAIPLLDVYESIRDTDAKVIMLCANNYPAKCAGNIGFDNLFGFNDHLREVCGLRTVELSDDCWEVGQLMSPTEMRRDGTPFRTIEHLAEQAGVYIAAVGTGANLSYAFMKGLHVGAFDLPEQGQAYWLNICNAWTDFVAELHVQVQTGKRVATLNDEYINTTLPLQQAIKYIYEKFPAFHAGEIQYGYIDPLTPVSLSEAMNMVFCKKLNDYHSDVLVSWEQMQYRGMEPNTVEQQVRLSRLMTLNSPRGYFATMADHGHVSVRGDRITQDPRDYDVREFAMSYIDPIVFGHHNCLLDNRKEAYTRAASKRDMDAASAAKEGHTTTDACPFPERFRDVNKEWLLPTIENPHVRLVVASPEPKCSIGTDLSKLAEDVAEATVMTAEVIRKTGKFEESSLLPFVFVTKGYVGVLDTLLAKHVDK